MPTTKNNDLESNIELFKFWKKRKSLSILHNIAYWFKFIIFSMNSMNQKSTA